MTRMPKNESNLVPEMSLCASLETVQEREKEGMQRKKNGTICVASFTAAHDGTKHWYLQWEGNATMLLLCRRAAGRKEYRC